MYLVAIAIALISLLPVPEPLIGQCDVLEYNTVVDERGRVTYRQAIGWRCTRDGMRVMWFRGMGVKPWPKAERRGGYWWVRLPDGVTVRAGGFADTVSNYDRELADRKHLAAAKRWGRVTDPVPRGE